MKIIVKATTTAGRISYTGIFPSTCEAVLDCLRRHGMCRRIAVVAV